MEAQNAEPVETYNQVMVPLLALLCIACQISPATLKVHLDIGPLSPIERPGQNIKVPPEMYKSYEAHLFIADSPRKHAEKVLKTMSFDANGNFNLKLTPGQYTVEVARANMKLNPRMLRISEPKFVRLFAGRTTELKLFVDTGIR